MHLIIALMATTSAFFAKEKRGFKKAPIWNSTAYNLGFLTRRFLLLLLLHIDFVSSFSKHSRRDWQDIKFWHLFNLNLIKKEQEIKEDPEIATITQRNTSLFVISIHMGFEII